MSEAEKKDCEKNTTLMGRKVEMERKNTVSVGDIKEFAFLKSTKKEAEAPVAAAVPEQVKKEVKP